MQIELNLTPFICEAFASNKALHKEIEKVYEKNKIEYYKLAKSSPYYNHEIITSQSIFKEIAMKRILGILIENDQAKILHLIKKGWKFLYEIVKKKKVIKISEILFELIPPNRKELIDKYTNDEINAIAIISIVLATIWEKEIDENDHGYRVIMESCYTRQEHIEKGYTRFSYSKLDAETRKKICNLKEKIYEKGNISRYYVYHDESEIEEMAKFSKGLSFLLDTEKLSSSIIEDEPISEKEVEEILAAYYVVNKNQNVTEAAKFFTAGYMIRALLRAYRNLKTEHFKTSRETLFLDIETAQHETDQAKAEVSRLTAIIKEKDAEIIRLQKQVTTEYGRAVQEYQSQIKEKNKKIDLLQIEITKLKNQIKDLELALFNQLEEDTSITDIDLTHIKGVIIGGHERWQTKMKEVIPANWRFINLNENFSSDLLINADYIFFNTNHLSHAVYYPAIYEARKRDIPVGYIKKTNENECLIEIKNQVVRRVS